MNVSIVTCFYKLEKSKHTFQEYVEWINNLILNLNDAKIIIFTNKNDEPFMQNILSKNKSINYTIIIREIDDLYISKRYQNIWNEQYVMDNQKNCGRSIECYKIWNSKFSFLKDAIELNPYKSNKFIWNDIGNVRNKNMSPYIKTYPNHNNISDKKLDIVLLKGFTNEKQLFFDNEVHFSGSMFGGGKDVILKLCKLYYLYFDLYIRKNKFIGCDQQIISSLYLRNKAFFNCVIPNKNVHIDTWFYLYHYYGNNNIHLR